VEVGMGAAFPGLRRRKGVKGGKESRAGNLAHLPCPMGIVMISVPGNELVRGTSRYWRNVGVIFQLVRYHHSVSEAGNPQPVIHH